MKVYLYPGSFDPITYGHIDIIERASKIADKLIVAVLHNPQKKCLFAIDERVDMVQNSIKHLSNVSVSSFEGLTVDFCKINNVSIIVRGLRAITDFDYELQLAHTNFELYDKIDTVFFITNLKYSYLSSTTVKQVAEFNGDVSKFVTEYVKNKLIDKFQKG